MPKINIVLGDAKNYFGDADLILTDPPYEMPGEILGKILSQYKSQHLVLITSMRQLIELVTAFPLWRISFDFVVDCVVPKKSKNYSTPNYTHQTGVYLTTSGARSIFDRRLRSRSDVFSDNGYWPTILNAPRNKMKTHGHAKNQTMITDLLGSFDATTILDPFCGSGTTGFAAFELRRECTLIERDETVFNSTAKALRLGGAVVEIVKMHK